MPIVRLIYTLHRFSHKTLLLLSQASKGKGGLDDGGDDFGVVFESVAGGAHLVKEVRFGSLAHHCGKIEKGDEVVQVRRLFVFKYCLLILFQ